MKRNIKSFSLQDWLNYILASHRQRHTHDLNPLRSLVSRYQLSKFSCPIIVVTGTNGKGSCIKLLESIYTFQGYRVGAYTSPHCLRFHERITINGQPIADDELINAFEKIEVIRDRVKLSFFEFITLSALYIFKQATLDVLLLEVGVGGMFDPVNLLDADLVLLTTIALDHTDMLGKTRDDIATAKAGLFRSNCPVICGEPLPPPYIFQYAKQLNSPISWIHRDFEYAYNLEQRLWHWQMDEIEYHRLPLPKIKFQNAALVLAALTKLQCKLPITKTAIVKGLKFTQLPGRFELVPASNCILDVAHNVQAVKWLVCQLTRLNITGRILGVFATFHEKDISGIIQHIKPYITTWYVGPLHGFCRTSGHHEIMKQLAQADIQSRYLLPSVHEAFDTARSMIRKNDYVLVFGSFHTVAIVKELLLQS